MANAIQKFTPLEMGLIDEGRFMDQANADLLDIQATLLEFRDRHGDRAKGAKAKLTIEVTLVCESPDEEMFSIRALTKKGTPARPASTTMAIAATSDEGRPCLFIRRSGSDEVTPRQGKLATATGETIDQKTGEVIENQ